MGGRGTYEKGRQKPLPTVEFPPNRSQLKHVFRKAHNMDDTPANRALIEETVRDENALGMDASGNTYYTKLLDNGSEVWVKMRGRVVQNAGLNIKPKTDWSKTIVEG